MSLSALPPKPEALDVEAYENICNCEGTPTPDKLEYLRAIAECGPDLSRARKVHSELCMGREMAGSRPPDLLPDEGLGVFVPAHSFRSAIAESNDWPFFKLKGLYRQWLSYEETKAVLGVRARGGIVVVVCHRPSALVGVDTVLVMLAGRQQAFGPKEQVLQPPPQQQQPPAVRQQPAFRISS